MHLSGVHLLMTYRCNSSCEHCFVWGDPFQDGAMTLDAIGEILRQADSLGSVSSIYFEGGEPFLYYAVMLRGLRMASDRGFSTGVVTNGYWATGDEDAAEWLRPLSGLAGDLSVSRDLYHEEEPVGLKAERISRAARDLGIPCGTISIAQPLEQAEAQAAGGLPRGKSPIMYRGRAAVRLAPGVSQRPWQEFTECPCEDLVEPGRVHVDPFGNLHICQGIVVGNLFAASLGKICRRYNVGAHPITGPLHRGGPVELVEQYGLPRRDLYADACHMCYEARSNLRSRFADILGPGQMYGGRQVHQEGR